MKAIPNRAAFELARMAEAAKEARVAVDRARALMRPAKGKDKATARRALKRAEALLSKSDRALQAEEQGEAAAPSVQRHAILQGDVVLRQHRIVTHGRTATLVTALDHLRNRSSITDEQYAAGKRYRVAWEMANMDAFPIGLGEGIGGTPCSGNRRIEEAIGASWLLQPMRQALGQYGSALVDHVVVYDLSISVWATNQRINPQYAMGQLQVLLGMLAGK